MEIEFLRQEAKRQKEEFLESERDRKKLKSSGSILLTRSVSDINTSNSLIYQLPEEVMLNIFGFLDGANILQCTRVSNSWKFLATDSFLWRNLFEYASKTWHSSEENQSKIRKNILCALKCSEASVRAVAFECMTDIISNHYSNSSRSMPMEQFADFALKALDFDEDIVVIQALEFFCTMCEKEKKSQVPSTVSLESLLPVVDPLNIKEKEDDKKTKKLSTNSTLFNNLLELISKVLKFIKTKPIDRDDWNIQKAAAACLSLLTESDVTLFITSHIYSSNYNELDGALLSLGCIISSSSNLTLQTFVSKVTIILCDNLQHMNVVYEHMGSKDETVRESAAWTLGKICKYEKRVALVQTMSQCVIVLKNALHDSLPVAKNACWAIANLLDGNGGNIDDKYSNTLIGELVSVSKRKELREHVYNSLFSIIDAGKTIYSEIVSKLIELLDDLIKNHNSNSNNESSSYEALICDLLGLAIYKMKSEITPWSNRLINLFSTTLKLSFDAKSKKEMCSAITALLSNVNYEHAELTVHLGEFLQFVLSMAQDVRDRETFGVAIGVIVDLSNNIVSEELLPFLESIIATLIAALKNASINRKQQAEVISCMGDLSVAIGGLGVFDTYFEDIITSIGHTFKPPKGNDLAEYNLYNGIRQSGFETYSLMLQALEKESKENLFFLHAIPLINSIVELHEDPKRDLNAEKAAIGLIGDLVQSFKLQIIEKLNNPTIRDLIYSGTIDMDAKFRETALWAKQVILEVDPQFFGPTK